MDLKSGSYVHLMGIGGSGMSAIATVMLEQGYRVSGCDLEMSPLVERLESRALKVSKGHTPAHLEGLNKPDAVIVSAAISKDNPELVAAREADIPVYKRGEIIGQLMQDKQGISVAGTHGKTTIAAMAAYVLTQAGLDPSYIVGGVLRNTSTNGYAGKGRPFIVEADEYDDMFLDLNHKIAIVTGIEHDHPDQFSSLHDVVLSINKFVGRLPDDGLLIACYDDPQARLLAERRRKEGKPVLTYGLSHGAELRAVEIIPRREGGFDFIAKQGLMMKGMAQIRLTGEHNLRNALAVLALAEHVGLQFEMAAAMLSEFEGVERRFEFKGRVAGITTIDDYAHHPTAIRATLEGARTRFGSRPIWVVFQPHTFTRTKALLDELVTAFDLADHVIITDIYGSRETDTLGMSSPDLVKAIKHSDVRHISNFKEVVTHLAIALGTADVVITMSAGDANKIHEGLLIALKKRFTGQLSQTVDMRNKITTLREQYIDELTERESTGRLTAEESKTWHRFLEEATLTTGLLERLLEQLREEGAPGDVKAAGSSGDENKPDKDGKTGDGTPPNV